MVKIDLNIPGWNEHNPPSFQVKYRYWFKCYKDVVTSPGLYGLSAQQKWFWVYLLCQACHQQNSKIEFILEHAEQICGLSAFEIFDAIRRLNINKTIEIAEDWEDVFVGIEAVDEAKDVEISQFGAPDMGKNVRRRPLEKKREEKIEEIEEKRKDISIEVKKVSPSMPMEDSLKNHFIYLSEQILKIYPDQEFVNREKEKMKVWLNANSKKVPKSKAGWSRFVMSWLEKGWERHRKMIPSNKPAEKSFAEIWAEEERKKQEENGS